MKKSFTYIFSLIALTAMGQKSSFEPNFGIVASANFTTVHMAYDNFVGRGLGSFGVFFQKPITPYHTNRYFNRLDYTIEPAMSWLSFRDKSSDKRFQSNFIDLSLYLNYVPDRMSDDLRLFAGVRPSYLTYTSTSIINYGEYSIINNDSQNLNQRGDIDFSGVLGLSISMGEIASLEIKYVHSFTNKTTATEFRGRPSAVEVGLKLSAIRIRDKIIDVEKIQVDELNKRAQGTLLIMLEEPDEKLIKELVDENKVDDAKYVRKLQEQTNLNIIKEFRANFDFCKIEFFMNSNANKVNRGKFDGVFVDDNLSPKENVSFDTTNYFLAAFVEDVSDYTHKPDYGLYFYDPKFIQLGSPYNTGANGLGIFVGGDPMNYFRRIKTSGYIADDFRKVIKKANSRLQMGRISVN
ncbi:MAG: hypothetical protein K9I36_01795 [Bacteroidia bacterium]|nr:hypothetical protein [Bacteroidia bacterium]MCF8425435.1 hypothetical protein [Bacteroidia bacterium]